MGVQQVALFHCTMWMWVLWLLLWIDGTDGGTGVRLFTEMYEGYENVVNRNIRFYMNGYIIIILPIVDKKKNDYLHTYT